MKRIFPALAVTLVSAGLLPATAAADVITLGATKTPLVAPTCPANVSQSGCKIVLPEVTALETIRDGVAYPTKVKHAGQIVALEVGLSAISSDAATVRKDIAYLDTAHGGPPAVRVTVLRPVGKRKDNGWEVAAQSAQIAVSRFLGRVVQFPLQNGLPVVPGETIALTVPTWAPVLSFELSSKQFAYRQSRRENCANSPTTIQAQLTIGSETSYGCNYKGTRVEYTATEVTSPAPNK